MRILFMLAGLPLAAHAAVPTELNHQGRVLDALGNPVSGAAEVGIALYSSEAAVTPLWNDSWSLDLQDGYYSVTLADDDDGTALNPAWFGTGVWLQVLVDGAPHGDRTPLRPAPIALSALSVAGSSAGIALSEGSRRWSDGSYAATCEDYRTGQGTQVYQGDIGTGLYALDPDGDGTPFTAWCDMDTDGGGWMLMLSYDKPVAVNPPLVGSTLPQSPSGTMSHAYLNELGLPAGLFDEVRFYCTTTAHSRVMHFKISHWAILQDAYDAQSTAVPSQYQDRFLPLPGHTAYLPAQAQSEVNTAGAAFTQFPIYLGNNYHWAVSGHGARWECDDWAENTGNGNGAQYATFHQIWVR